MPIIEEPTVATWPEPREIALVRSTIDESLQALSHAAIGVGMAATPVAYDRWITEMVRLRLDLAKQIGRLFDRLEARE